VRLRHLWPIADRLEYAQARQRSVAWSGGSDLREAVAQARGSCAEFINSWCVIDDAQLSLSSSGTYPFHLWDPQRSLLTLLLTSRKTVILKARQLGVSWLACAYCLWVALFRPNQLVVLFSKGQTEADELLRRVKVLYERLPADFREHVPSPGRKWGTETIEFANGSRVMSFPATQNAGRTFTASIAVVDELGFIQWDHNLWNALKPTVDGGGQLIALSTANGTDNLFAELWSGIALGTLRGYSVRFMGALERPDRSPSWYSEREAEATDLNLFRQEYPLSAEEAFRVTARTPFLPTPLWWEQCAGEVPPMGEREAVVISLDASISGDSFGLVALSRPRSLNPKRLAVREVREWVPQGEPLDHRVIKEEVVDLCKRLRVAQLTYDPYQLHLFAQQLEAELRVWVNPFNQMGDRLIADSSLLEQIRGGSILYGDNEGTRRLTRHLANADRKVDSEEHKLRMIKGRGHIDLAVCLSQAAHRAGELNI